ncbi:MAG: lamin tail domain-containing protein [Bacteroidota bacterium]|nr:lamin tail domain-containing protein [Bacteroidota bacterium]
MYIGKLVNHHYFRGLMLRIAFILCISTLCNSAFAQVTENFDDGDFTSNPAWSGSASLYSINGSKQLQSNGTGGEVSYLSTPSTMVSNTEWSFWVKFNLSPSLQNYCRYYLMSDQQDLSGSLNGYYIQLGGSTGTTDSIALYKQTGINRVRIIAGRPATVGKSLNQLRVKVQRNTSGLWQLLSDTSGKQSYAIEGSATDNQFTSTSYTGMYCRYTATNVLNFYWDDITIKSSLDTIPPGLASINVLSVNKLEVVFDELLDATSAKVLTNYIGNNGLGNPASLIFDNLQTVTLTFANNFTINTTYTLTINNVKDLAANQVNGLNKTFVYSTQTVKPILINELFADQSPKIGLPDYEFIELYNPNKFSIDLTNWTISDGTSTGTLSNTFGTPTIPPDSFIILCSHVSSGDYAVYGPIAIVNGFPSLNNTGDKITLKNNLGQLINEVNYTDKWYHDGTKAQGGWSMERINPLTQCDGITNWAASKNAIGGTPGKGNSILSTILDKTSPDISYLFYTSQNTVSVSLSEPITASSFASATFAYSNFISIISKQINTTFDTITLLLSNNMKNGQPYNLQITGLSDCEGNTQKMTGTIIYQDYKIAEFNDIVIDEIYTNPLPNTPLPNMEWVELKNRSKSPILIKNWTISDGVSKAKIVFAVLRPDSFLVMCHEAFVSKMTPYATTIGLSSFPSLNNSGDRISITNEIGQVIHTVNYSDAWYGNSLKRNGGWSLEMIDTDNPCGGINNWKPTSDKLGGTPGRNNSVQASNPDNQKPTLARVYVPAANRLILYFAEPVDSNSIHIDSIEVSNWGLLPVSIQSISPDYTVYELIYNDTFGHHKLYKVSVKGFYDCSGNKGYDDAIEFMLTDAIDTGDLALNEIMFNPKSGCVDYVELYNKSNHAVDLKNLQLGSIVDGQYSGVTIAAPDGYIVLPGQYVCLSEDENIIKKYYQTINPLWFCNVTNFPSYLDDKGGIVILNNNLQEVDKFEYNKNMHHLLVDDDEGVSLERVNFTRPTNEITNWQSAAGSVGFGTPGYANSQYNGTTTGDDLLEISPTVFSPDADGIDDVLNINIKFVNGGYAGKLYIYDVNGYLVKTLASWQVFGTNASVSWNGFKDNGDRAAVGHYIIVLDYYNLTGKTGKSRKVCALVEKKL